MIDVEQYIGREFQDKGRGPRYDCLGLVKAVYKDTYGFDPLPDFRENYDDTGDWENIGNCIKQEQANWKAIDQPEKGAVIVFNIQGRPHHIGICTGFSKGHAWFLHIHEQINTTHERLASTIWNQRIEAIYVYE